LRIIGISMAVSAAASAAAEPEMAAMITAAAMATMPRPPRMWPIQASAKSTMRREMPPAFMSSPASMKKGMASNGKLSAPSTILGWSYFRCGMTR
jgi:hypothetical protein